MFTDAGPLELWQASRKIEKLAIAMQLLGLVWAVLNMAVLAILVSIPVLVCLYRLALMRALVAKPDEWWASEAAGPPGEQQTQEPPQRGGSLGDFR